MAGVQSVNAASDLFATLNAQTRAGATASATTSEDVQNRFLKLLVTQLQNQDPLNPLDNAAVTTQVSQISTVTGIEKLNATLEVLLGSYREAQAMQGAALMGRNVLVSGSRLTLAGGQAAAGVNLAEAADQVKLTILDGAGTVVQSQNLGAREAGSFSFAWDGRNDAGVTMPPGNYSFKVSALRGADKVAAEPLQLGTVSALVKGANGFELEVGGIGRVGFDKVQQIL
ncbi:MAG TPA: flagellar hook assembly protein FlgD [Candidatus Accumulibacter phosphatis]|nr:MAG: Basal-body rod modification protein FlgD [Candidatus Accumulibacter sp. SK-11]HCN67514.1 flagellar hook assembly protein FlgD [Accumulibacter sp.]HCV12352.1 flagellar hook assembly protein FlgD [Accumulibacter sp.]HRL74825.1 flagellar hook assembly protein FlgD [Candidatus Accumulibacter phosphatis]HRQ95024.1 flagellar hook assembly protein FlgD [Candidatus Accumulibacter phosphatis]